jgi:hypothetical protein
MPDSSSTTGTETTRLTDSPRSAGALARARSPMHSQAFGGLPHRWHLFAFTLYPHRSGPSQPFARRTLKAMLQRPRPEKGSAGVLGPAVEGATAATEREGAETKMKAVGDRVF